MHSFLKIIKFSLASFSTVEISIMINQNDFKTFHRDIFLIQYCENYTKNLIYYILLSNEHTKMISYKSKILSNFQIEFTMYYKKIEYM